jgi:hypothetical protein
MAKFDNNINVTKSKTTQKINLRTLLGRRPSEEEKEQFARLSIEQIRSRTLDGDDYSGREFTPYSEEHAAKKGVSVDSVDMFLEGDMLDSIDTLRTTRDTIEIGISGGKEALKSHGHNTGGGFLPQRRFFGVTREEAKRIAQQISQDKEESPRITLAQLRDAINLIGLERGDS